MTEEINGQAKRHPQIKGGEVQKRDEGNLKSSNVTNDSYEDLLMLSPELFPLYPKTGITMIDDTMTAVGIYKGDILIITYDDKPDDGMLVLAYVGGKKMVRFYFEDDDGNKWLLSKNEDVEPICISIRDDVKIMARILRHIGKAPRIKYNEAKKLTREAKNAVKKTKVASLKHAKWVIKHLGKDVNVMRDWFSFYRPLVQFGVVDDKDYKGFCNLIKETLPEHQHQPKYDEMQRLDDGCFRKPVEEWTPATSPLKNFNRFREYQNRALCVISYLELEESHDDLTKSHEKST